MSSREVKVMPGDVLATLEEYLPGEGTYVDEERGVVRAAHAGVAVYDKTARTVSVRPVKRVKMPGPGASVVGVVMGVRHDLVLVEIYGQVELRNRPAWLWEFSGKYSGAIAIYNIADEFIKDIHDYFRLSDVVLVRTLNRGNPYHLSSKGPQYGVVYAQCGRCGAPMVPLNPKAMKCPRCGNVEKRKVSVYAGNRLFAQSLKRMILIPHF